MKAKRTEEEAKALLKLWGVKTEYTREYGWAFDEEFHYKHRSVFDLTRNCDAYQKTRTHNDLVKFILKYVPNP